MGLALVVLASAGCEEEVRPPPASPIVDEDVAGTAYVDTSAGHATAAEGEGRHGGYVQLGIYFAGDHVIEIRTTGRVDAGFEPGATPPIDFGDHPLVVTDDLVIEPAASEPPVGTPYLLPLASGLITDSSPSVVRIADGDSEIGDEPAVSGIHVRSGAKLTLHPLGPDGFSRLKLTHDLLVEGGVDTPDVDVDRRGSLWFDVDGDVLVTGRIDVRGQHPGQDAGWLHIWPLGRVHVHGQLLASGADAVDADAGAGGIMWITGFGDGTEPADFECTGRIIVRGGSATGSSGRGGDGGGIQFDTPGDVRVSGELDASGGDGISGGGDAGSIWLQARRGTIHNSTDLHADGGETIEGSGGSGGWLTIAATSHLYSSGDLWARGADSTDAEVPDYEVRGEGGRIRLSSNALEDPPTPPGDVWVSGNLDAHGGAAPLAPRDGGSVGVAITSRSPSEPPRTITLAGYRDIDARGGDGAAEGGYGGRVYLVAADDETAVRGTVVVDATITTSGGEADPGDSGSVGGGGGDLVVDADRLTLGLVFQRGGDGETPGEDGVIRSR